MILRLILIFFLIWNHAFSPYDGAWETFRGYPDIPTYYWLGRVTFYLRLTTMVFISGYLFGYNVNRKPDNLSAAKCILKKVRRLLLPGVIFSSLYYAVFFDLHAPVTEICYSILEGCGHLWFLPMLFWCFVAIYVVERLGVNPRLVLALAIVAAILRPTLPLRLAHASYYFMFFYIGYGLSRNTLNFMKPTYRLWPILCALGVYILTFALDEGIKSVDFCASERLRYYALNAASHSHLRQRTAGMLLVGPLLCGRSPHVALVDDTPVHVLLWSVCLSSVLPEVHVLRDRAALRGQLLCPALDRHVPDAGPVADGYAPDAEDPLRQVPDRLMYSRLPSPPGTRGAGHNRG